MLALLVVAALAGVEATNTLAPGEGNQPLTASGSNVSKVHLVFTHHLDVGLDLALKETADCVGFATKILQRYFDDFIPRALKLSGQARAATPPFHFRYQIHPWVGAMALNCVSYTVQDHCPLNPGRLKCPPPAALAAFEAGARRGDIVWSAGPMNLNPGAVADPELFSDLISDISGELDAQFTNHSDSRRRRRRRVWSNADVKGFVRSAIPSMVSAGVNVLSVNTNGHPRPCSHNDCPGPQPAVGNNNASLFRWRDPPSNKSVTVIFHNSYANRYNLNSRGRLATDRSEAIIVGGTALMSYFRSDNTGPPDSLAEVKSVFAATQAVFPQAEVIASSLDAFATEALSDSAVAALPEYTWEWGDVWITGMSTDPRRLSVYREIVRARAECLTSGVRTSQTSSYRCVRGSAELKNMSRYLAKFSEHTQGEQNEKWNPGYRASGADLDTTSWSNADFAKVHNAQHNIFEFGELSWLEARIFNTLAIGAAPPPLRTEITSRLAAITASEAVAEPPVQGMHKAASVTGPFCGKTALTFDPLTGALNLTLSGKRYNNLLRYSYVTYADDEGWDKRPNVKKLAAAEDKVWHATPTAVFTATGSDGSCKLVMVAATPGEAHSKYGAPSSQWLEVSVSGSNSGEVAVDATLQLRGKQATRLGESMMVSNQPELGAATSGIGSGGRWEMDVLSEWIRPEEVVNGGNQYQHAINSGVRFLTNDDGRGSAGLLLESLDAGMACPMVSSGGGAALALGGSTPMGEGVSGVMTRDRQAGMALNLYNNLMPISGYAQWYPFGTGEFYQRADESMSFRFRLSALERAS